MSSSSLSSSSSSPLPDVFKELGSILDENGLGDLTHSLLKPPSSAALPSLSRGHVMSSSSARAASSLYLDSPSAVNSMDLLRSPFQASAYSSSPAYFRSLPVSYSPLFPSPFRPSAALPSLPLSYPMSPSPSSVIMFDHKQRFAHAASSSPSSSLSAFSPSPFRRSSFSPFRSPPHLHRLRSGGERSGFLPLLGSPLRHLDERQGDADDERLQRVEEDDVTQSSFPSLSTVTTASSSTLSSVPSTSSALSFSLNPAFHANTASSSLSPFPSFPSSTSNLLKRPAPFPSAPSSPPSRNKRLKMTNSRSSLDPSPVPMSGGGGGGGGSRQQKGLRHFSLKVCEKVEQQGVTTYNSVADALVADLAADPSIMGDDDGGDDEEGGGGSQEGGGVKRKKKRGYDEKNIRRRVYDALNVLMAMGIIQKVSSSLSSLHVSDSNTLRPLADCSACRCVW